MQGNIAKWYVKTGDEVAAGTVLADIETDKATMAFENQEDGFIAALLKPDGAKDIPVGEAVAIIVEEASDIAAFANYSSSDAAAPAGAGAPAPAAAAPAAAQPAAGSFPDYTVSCGLGLHRPSQTIALAVVDACAQRTFAFCGLLDGITHVGSAASYVSRRIGSQ